MSLTDGLNASKWAAWRQMFDREEHEEGESTSERTFEYLLTHIE